MIRWIAAFTVACAAIGILSVLLVMSLVGSDGFGTWDVFVDGESIPAAPIAVAVAIGVSILVGCVVSLLASIVIVVPLAVAGALLLGLSPVLVPALLVVGACALLVRRNRRRATARVAPVDGPR